MLAINTTIKSGKNKQKLIQLCISRFLEKDYGTQYFIIIKNVLADLDVNKKTMIFNSEFEKAIEKIYQQHPDFAKFLIDEYINKANSADEEVHFIKDHVMYTRLELIAMIIFKQKGRECPDEFYNLFVFLATKEDQEGYMTYFFKYLTDNNLITRDNSRIFFVIFESPQDSSGIFKFSDLVFKAFRKVFLAVNINSGALGKPYQRRRTYYSIANSDKFVFKNIVWKICLRGKMEPEMKDKFIHLLYQCYFRGQRCYDSSEAETAWKEFQETINGIITKNTLKTEFEIENFSKIISFVLEHCRGGIHKGIHLPNPNQTPVLIKVVILIFYKRKYFL